MSGVFRFGSFDLLLGFPFLPDEVQPTPKRQLFRIIFSRSFCTPIFILCG